MDTTPIFAEILIIGLEALVWIVLAVATIVGPGALDVGPLASNEGLAVLLVVAAAYALGVAFDRAADSFLLLVDPWVDYRTPLYRRRAVEHMNTMRIRLMAPDLGVAQFLELPRRVRGEGRGGGAVRGRLVRSPEGQVEARRRPLGGACSSRSAVIDAALEAIGRTPG